jgi:hypothetical protein
MKTKNDTGRVPEHESTPETVDAHATRRMTLVENVILTVKVLAGFGLLGTALWAISSWTSGR